MQNINHLVGWLNKAAIFEYAPLPSSPLHRPIEHPTHFSTKNSYVKIFNLRHYLSQSKSQANTVYFSYLYTRADKTVYTKRQLKNVLQCHATVPYADNGDLNFGLSYYLNTHAHLVWNYLVSMALKDRRWLNTTLPLMDRYLRI